MPEDLEGVVRIYNESFRNLRSCWANPMTVEWFEKRFGAPLRAKTGTAFIGEYENKPIGYVLVTKQQRPEVCLVAYVSGICVVPRFQRQGVGTRLMEKAFEWAIEQDAVIVENDDEIIENPVALSFFEKLSFEIFHRGSYMSKDLGLADDFAVPEKDEVRELRVEDLDQLLRVRRESFKEFGPWYSKPDGKAFKRGMRNRIGRDDVKVCVAMMANALIGYVVCSINEDNREAGAIRVVCVLPQHRNKNIGTALMTHAFAFLRKSNVKIVETATETAEGFYEKVGFKVNAEFVRVRKHL